MLDTHTLILINYCRTFDNRRHITNENSHAVADATRKQVCLSLSLILILLSLSLPFLDLLLLANDNSIGQSYHLLANKFFGLNWVYCVTQIYWLHIIVEDTSDDTQPINRLV